jgi:hypothetical protein
MIYTIGHTESYTQYFKEQGTPQKLGRTKNYNGEYYSGGSVWKTKEEAEKNCPSGYSVYGVLADWEKDTEKNETENYHDLLVTSDLVQLTF